VPDMALSAASAPVSSTQMLLQDKKLSLNTMNGTILVSSIRQ
jgi:phosphosulfolactate phosphohydrolase-like enzyme